MNDSRDIGDGQDVVCEPDNRCGLVTLDRPRALNALTYGMIAEMERHYPVWAADPHIYAIVMRSTSPRAFCSGGDLKALYDWRRRGEVATILGLYGLEYQHNWTLDRFCKPHVALIDGIVMGGGVGICLYGTHRVGAPGLRFAMPEVGIGFFPDVGASWFLSRLPGAVGMYLALTGRAIGQADAFALDLITHCVPADRFGDIHAALREAEPVDDLLASLHAPPGDGDLAASRPVIDRAFAAASVEEILERLDAETGEWADWARGTAAEIRTKSPVALKVAHRLVRRGAGGGLDDALRLDYRVARRFIEGEEFHEGIRAAVIDKDRRPRWNPAALSQVSDDMVDGFLAPLADGELDLVDPYA